MRAGRVILAEMMSARLHEDEMYFKLSESTAYPTINSILVLGAGELGMAVLESVSRRIAHGKTKLAVLLRPTTDDSTNSLKRLQYDRVRALGAQIVECDLASASETDIAKQLQHFSNVIGCTGFVGGSGTQLKITRAALAASVDRYVPWQFGVDYDAIGRGSAQDVFDEQLDVRDLLRGQQQTKWLIISTGMFTSFLFDPSFGIVDLQSNEVHALGAPENQVTVTTAEDIGALTATILFAEPQIANQVVYTAGETLSYSRLADIVDEVLNRNVCRVTLSVARLKDELAADADSAIKKYRVVFAGDRGVSWPVAKTYNAQHSIAVTDVREWIRQNLT